MDISGEFLESESYTKVCSDYGLAAGLEVASFYRRYLNFLAISFPVWSMTEPARERSDVDQFILSEIESVPHLEALLLLWNSQPRHWTLDEMAASLYLSPEHTVPVLRDLAQRRLVCAESGRYFFCPNHPKHDVIARLDQQYRHEVVRISTMIHSKPSASVRAFARAFKFTKD